MGSLRKGRILVVSFGFERAPDAAGDRRRDPGRPQGRDRRPLDAEEPQHRPRLGYLDVPGSHRRGSRRRRWLPPGQVMILCTGSQGEPMSALTRIAYNDHPSISIERGDTVILSAKPVPGNELRVHDSINRLAQMGAEVLYQEIAPVHVSGHACSASCARRSRCASARGHARARGVPDAGGARPARARGRRAGGGDPDRRERLRGGARARADAAPSTGSRRASPSSTASASATSGTWRCATGAASPRTAS